jgi:hypothetical protein
MPRGKWAGVENQEDKIVQRGRCVHRNWSQIAITIGLLCILFLGCCLPIAVFRDSQSSSPNVHSKIQCKNSARGKIEAPFDRPRIVPTSGHSWSSADLSASRIRAPSNTRGFASRAPNPFPLHGSRLHSTDVTS